MAIFFFLPSILLSGFMFPFRGKPDWAQAIGEVLPLTHFLRILLKGNGWGDIAPELGPLVAFLFLALFVALRRYRPRARAARRLPFPRPLRRPAALSPDARQDGITAPSDEFKAPSITLCSERLIGRILQVQKGFDSGYVSAT